MLVFALKAFASEALRLLWSESNQTTRTICQRVSAEEYARDGTEPANFLRGLSEPEGAHLLATDITGTRRAVSALINVDLTDGQYAALCDFVYNVGALNFSKSTLLQAINDEEEDRIPPQCRRWVLADGKELSALKVRREREIKLFFEGQPIPKALPPAGEKLTPIDIRKGE